MYKRQGTVCAAIKNLESMGLVRREHVYKEDGTYAANKYTIALPVGGRWFALNLSELSLIHILAAPELQAVWDRTKP